MKGFFLNFDNILVYIGTTYIILIHVGVYRTPPKNRYGCSRPKVNVTHTEGLEELNCRI